MDAAATRENPKFTACWCDEDFVGKVANIASRVHTLTQCERTAMRCLCQLTFSLGGFDDCDSEAESDVTEDFECCNGDE
eukprot:6982889-Alexandrium_andersonii.AAC.1